MAVSMRPMAGLDRTPRVRRDLVDDGADGSRKRGGDGLGANAGSRQQGDGQHDPGGGREGGQNERLIRTSSAYVPSSLRDRIHEN